MGVDVGVDGSERVDGGEVVSIGNAVGELKIPYIDTVLAIPRVLSTRQPEDFCLKCASLLRLHVLCRLSNVLETKIDEFPPRELVSCFGGRGVCGRRTFAAGRGFFVAEADVLSGAVSDDVEFAEPCHSADGPQVVGSILSQEIPRKGFNVVLMSLGSGVVVL